MFCGKQAACDSLQYFLVNTCCIDKRKISELSHLINSMFQWYKNATKCYAFLSDVSAPTKDTQLHLSTWKHLFKRADGLVKAGRFKNSWLQHPSRVYIYCPTTCHSRLGRQEDRRQEAGATTPGQTEHRPVASHFRQCGQRCCKIRRFI